MEQVLAAPEAVGCCRHEEGLSADTNGVVAALEEKPGLTIPGKAPAPTGSSEAASDCTIEPMVASKPRTSTESSVAPPKSSMSEDGDSTAASSEIPTVLPRLMSDSSSDTGGSSPPVAEEGPDSLSVGASGPSIAEVEAAPKVLRWDKGEGRWVPHHFPELDFEEPCLGAEGFEFASNSFTREDVGRAGAPEVGAPSCPAGFSILEELFGPRKAHQFSASAPEFVPTQKPPPAAKAAMAAPEFVPAHKAPPAAKAAKAVPEFVPAQKSPIVMPAGPPCTQPGDGATTKKPHRSKTNKMPVSLASQGGGCSTRGADARCEGNPDEDKDGQLAGATGRGGGAENQT